MFINAIQTGTEEKLKRTNMIQSMKKEGYILQDHKQLKLRDYTVTDEPRLAVSLYNELLRWRGGKHRIAAAQVLDLEYIYAYFVIWHPSSDKRECLDKPGIVEI